MLHYELTKTYVRSRKSHSAPFVTVTAIVSFTSFSVFVFSPKCCCPNHKPFARTNLINYRLQNRAARVLTQSSYDADANQLIKKLGWDNLETRRQKLKAEMVSKSLNGLTPSYLSSKFIQRSDMITSYNLHNSQNKLAIPLPRTNYYKNSFSYSGAVLWNSLPSPVRQATSLTNVRRLLINSDTAFMKNRL